MVIPVTGSIPAARKHDPVHEKALAYIRDSRTAIALLGKPIASSSSACTKGARGPSGAARVLRAAKVAPGVSSHRAGSQQIKRERSLDLRKSSRMPVRNWRESGCSDVPGDERRHRGTGPVCREAPAIRNFEGRRRRCAHVLVSPLTVGASAVKAGSSDPKELV